MSCTRNIETNEYDMNMITVCVLAFCMTFCLMYVRSSLKDKDLETTVWICVDLGKYQGHEMTRLIVNH